MSEEPKKRSKRGRPAKNPEKKQKVRSNSISSSGMPEIDYKQDKSKYHNRLLENYDEQYTNFLRDGISQQSQHLIRKIIHSPFVPESAKSQPLLMIFNSITTELMMNELEIVVLSIYLEKFVWQDESISLMTLLKYAAYAVKLYLCEEMSHINAHLSNTQPGFIEDFNLWQDKHKVYMSVNPKDLNDKFKELSKAVSLPGDTKIMDYNYYVDEILQITPNLLGEKHPIEELTKDPEIMSLYAAYKNNNKIVTKDSDETHLPVLEKLDSVLSGLHEPEKPVGGIHTASSTILKKIESLCEAYLSNNDEVKDEDD
ncbi:hypothetical protein SteCoe_16862 [Stentor coeruleus]|uniref:Uncharacterized protein n=1 Tax=Stentor coeruleus TaxID=5963 RepID=A0A1R2C0A4_9CILI|nr:hypothetical protein SteCoe_16862 [Stentor coeruleus]